MTTETTVLVTGVSGSLGLRLVGQLAGCRIIGVDVREPATKADHLNFVKLDLSEERSVAHLLELMRTHRPSAVVHLAFIMNPSRLDARDRPKMWHINVVGASRVSEAVAEFNRMVGGVEKLIFTSSAAVYGSTPRGFITEETSLKAKGLPYALHQQEADVTVQGRARTLRQCQTYILRSHSYAGAGAWNYELSSLRGEPDGAGFLGRRWRRNKKRVPVFLPSRGGHLDHRTQFVHVDDVARLIAYIVRCNDTGPELTVMNVAGRGDPLTLRRRLEIAGTPIKFLPFEALCRQAQGWLFRLGISDTPAAGLPYLSGPSVLDTARLRSFLGEHYRAVIQHTCEEALQESFSGSPANAQHLAAVNS